MSDKTEKSLLRILLVDDAEFDRIAFREAFTETDVIAEITEFDNAEDALVFLEQNPQAFDLVVSDYKMPGMSGLELCREIQKRSYYLPTVLLTGQGNEELVIEAIQSGVQDYFVKDITLGYHKLLPVKLPEVVQRFSDRRARQLAEQALENQYRLTGSLLVAIPNPVFYLNLKGRFLGCNPAFEEFFDKTLADSKGRLIFDIFPTAETRQEWTEDIATLSQGREEPIIREEEIETPAGQKNRHIISQKTTFTNAGGGLAGVLCVVIDITERIETEKELRQYRNHLEELVQTRTEALRKSEKKFRELSAQMGRVEQKERQRVATGLHDGIAQELALAKMNLQSLRQQMGDDPRAGEISGMVSLMERCIQNIKSLVFDLYPPILFELGLEAAIERLVETFREKHRLPCACDIDDEVKPLSPQKAEVLYAATRELLTNVIKHASATEATVTILRQKNDIVIIVSDNGHGFSISTEEGELVEQRGFGLFNVKDKIESVGGHMEIDSSTTPGARVILHAPLG